MNFKYSFISIFETFIYVFSRYTVLDTSRLALYTKVSVELHHLPYKMIVDGKEIWVTAQRPIPFSLFFILIGLGLGLCLGLANNQ